MKNGTIYLKALIHISLSSLGFLYLQCPAQVHKDEIIKTIFIKRDEIVTKFSNKTIFIRGEKVIYKDSSFSSNYITFNLKSNQLFLDNSDLVDITVDLSQVEKRANELFSFMQKLGVKAISSEEKALGIDIQLYLPDNRKVLFVREPDKVKNSKWKDYISGLTKLNANWYYTQ